jgi:hypothetical protein
MAAHDPGMAPRRFLPPWSVVEIPGGFRVQDATGQRLAYFYWWNDPTARYQADLLTETEAKGLAEAWRPGSGWNSAWRDLR